MLDLYVTSYYVTSEYVILTSLLVNNDNMLDLYVTSY
jgi:hypothetical protein